MDISARLEIKKPKVREEIEEVISSLEGVSLQRMAGPCDVVVLEIESEAELARIPSFQAACIFLTSDKMDTELLIQAMRTGVKEFFTQPIRKQEVKEAFLKFRDRKGQIQGTERKKGKIISVLGSKGGVGTTTLAVNLAFHLRELGKQVALVDMLPLFGGVPIFLNMDAPFHWGEIVKDISRLDSTYLMSILARHSSGLFVLPAPAVLDGLSPAETSAVVDKLLRFMQGMFDVVVVDGGHSLDDTSLKILQVTDTVFLVATLSLPCLTNVKRMLGTFRQLGYPEEESTKVIINQYHKKGLIQPKDAEQSIKRRIYWTVPQDEAVVTSAINQGKPIAAVARDADIDKSLRDLALEITRI